MRRRLRNSLFIGQCLVLVALFASSAFAQSGVIRGAVVDSLTRKPLLEASVSLLSARDSSLVTFGITDGDGRFDFQKVAVGTYRIVVTYVGYRGKARRIAVSADAPNPAVGTIDLVATSQTLGEVQVQGEKAPIAVKGDTLEFNADSFKTRPNSQVEDLLKKLPGVEVDRDGTVKAQGQAVTKVLVDGKPFFGDDPKMATRNLPADIIDKVQLYDQQSEQSQFSGVDDGDRQKTINITTKKDKRKGTFGQQSIGAGPQVGDAGADAMRYSGRASVNRFNNRGDGPSQQYSVLGMANNINQQGFTAQDLGLGSNFGGAGQGSGGNGGGGNNVRIGGGGGGNNGASGGAQVGTNAITQSWAAGLNYRVDGPRNTWGKKVDVAGSYNASHTNTLTDQFSRRENVLPGGSSSQTDSSFVTNRQNGSNNTNTNQRFNLRLDYRMDSLTTFRLIPNLSWLGSNFHTQSQSQTLDGQGVPANTSNTNYNSTGSGFTGNNTALLFRKFRKRGRTFSLNWSVAMNDQTSNGINQSLNTFARSNTPLSTTGVSTSAVSTSAVSTSAQTGLFDQVINQHNDQQTRSMTNSINVSYTEPLSMRQTLEFHYVLSDNHNTSNRYVNNFNEATARYDQLNTRLSNQFLNTFVTNRGGLTWQTTRLKYTYALGVDAQQASLNSDNITQLTTISRSFTNFLPNALFTYNFGKSRRLRVQYRTRINPPNVSQLQPVPDNTNPLNIRLGNASLQPEYSHNLSINFNRFEPSTFRNLFALLNLSRTDNKIVNATTFTRSGAQTTQPVNTSGYYTANGSLVLGQPVKFGEQKVNLNLTTNLTYNHGTSFVNSLPNVANNWLVGQG